MGIAPTGKSEGQKKLWAGSVSPPATPVAHVA